MSRELTQLKLIERSILKKYRKELWRPFTYAVKRYELIQPGDKIALGHHFNDVVEMTVIGMFCGSQLQVVPPKLHSTNFEGMELIRPLYCAHEEDILAWKRYDELEFIQCACRFTENCAMRDNGGGGSTRQEVKTLLKRLMRDSPNIEKSIFNSIHAVRLGTMVAHKHNGVFHTFLDGHNINKINNS